MFRTLYKLLQGDVSRRTMLFVVLPLFFLAYFGAIALAVWLYPGSYDWRYVTISKLLYPRNNPQFHQVAGIGIALAGLLMMPFAGYIRRRLQQATPRTAQAGALLFWIGCVLLTLGSLIHSHPAQGVSPVPKLHEILMRLAVIGIGVGMVVFNVCGIKAFFPEKVLQRRSLLISWNCLTLPLPVFTAVWLGARIYLHQTGQLHHHLANASPLWQLGFWEWIGSAVVFLFLTCAVLFLPAEGLRAEE